MKALIQHNDAVSLAGLYAAAQSHLIKGCQEIEMAEKLLRQMGLPDEIIYNTKRYTSTSSAEELREDSLLELKRRAWSFVIKRIELRELLAISKQKELDKQIEEGKNLPEFTAENIFGLIDGFVGDFDKVLKEAATEVFEYFRPRWRTKYKNNQANTFGFHKKIIADYALSLGGGWYLKWSFAKRLIALDNVFHLLDGQQIAKSSNRIDNLWDTHVKADRNSNKLSTTYFILKWFRNGNMHITFRRADLVDKLNALAGGDQLRSNAPIQE